MKSVYDLEEGTVFRLSGETGVLYLKTASGHMCVHNGNHYGDDGCSYTHVVCKIDLWAFSNTLEEKFRDGE